MERQATEKGFAGAQEKFLKRVDLEKAKKVKPKRISEKEIEKAWKEHQKATRAFAKKKRDPATINKVKTIKKKNQQMRAEIKALKYQRKFEQDRVRKEKDQIRQDTLKRSLKNALSMAVKYKLPRDAILSDFAKDNSMTAKDVKNMAESAGI